MPVFLRVTAMVLALFLATTAHAQIALPTSGGGETSVTLPDPLTPEAVRDLVSRLSDNDVRSLLLERLDAVAETEAEAEASGSVIDWFGNAGTSLGNSIWRTITVVPQIPAGIAKGLNNFYEPRGFGGFMGFLGWFALVIGAGAAVEFVFRKLTSGWRDRPRKSESLRDTLISLVRRFVLDAGGLVIFVSVAALMITNVMPTDSHHPRIPNSNRELAWMIVTVPIMYARIASMVVRFLQAPKNPHLRLLNSDDYWAAFFHRHSTIIGGIWGGMAIVIIFLASHGVAMGELRVGFWLNLLLIGWAIWTFWVGREAFAKMAAGSSPEENTKTESWVARAYPFLGIGLIVLTWLLTEYLASQQRWDLLDGRQYLTLSLLLFAPTYDTAIRGLVKHLAPPMRGEGVVAQAAYLTTKRSYVRIGRIIVFGWLIYTVADLWGLDFTNVAAAGVGAQAAVNAVEFMLILAIGYLIWELATLWINRKLAAEQTALGFDINDDEPGGGEGGGAGGSRLSTVLPLILLVMQAAIIVITLLLALGEAGLDTTPLLAGAGIVGLAVGFGAQKLVADVVGGVFFLIDDAFRTGEYVEVEGTVGTVEKISIRSMQMRHHKGPIHTIPYGEIPKITNYSRDWVIMKLKFTVPFETDPNKVKKLFKQIGKDMQQVPEFAADLLQPFKSQGVFDFDDVGMIIRGKFMAKPGKQFTLRKEIYNRVKKAFADNGIDFARREVRVAIPGLESADQLSDEQKEAIAAAAGDVAQQQSVEPPTKT